MSDMNISDGSDSAIDLSLPRSRVLRSSSATRTSKRENVMAAGPSNIGDKEEYFDAEASEPKTVMLVPKKRPDVSQQIQTEENQIMQTIDIVTKQTEAVEQVIAALPTEKLRNRSGATVKKSQKPELAAPGKPTVKPARETGKKQSQEASASQPSISKASTLQPSTSKASTSQPSTSRASTSQPSTSKASTLQPSTLKASTSQPSTSKASKTQKSTSKVSTSQPSTSKASTSQPSTSKASTSQPATSKASTSQPSTSKASTSQPSTSKASKTQKSTSKASKSQKSTSKASKSQESTSKTTSKASSTPLKVRKEADSNLQSGKKPLASTSVLSSSGSTIPDSRFWVETIKTRHDKR